jgi:hypothetical protein
MFSNIGVIDTHTHLVKRRASYIRSQGRVCKHRVSAFGAKDVAAGTPSVRCVAP